MAVRYRDLAAVAWQPAASAKVSKPEGADWTGVFLSPTGEIHLAYFGGGNAHSIIDINSRPVVFEPPQDARFDYPLVQHFRDGRWLVVDSRTEDEEPNAFLFDTAGRFMRSFFAGDGIETMQVDREGRIWIGYFDEGVFGYPFPGQPTGDSADDYGAEGLVRLDDEGTMEFGYNSNHDDRLIVDIYASTLDDEGRVWLCPREDFFLASITGDDVDYVFERAPMAYPRALSVGPDHIAFFGTLPHSSTVCLVERASGRLRLIQLRGPDGRTLNPRRIATRGGQALALAGDALYRLDHALLLEALGPWTDANSSTVDSAVQYQREEEAYKERSVLIIGGPDAGTHQVQNAQRPVGNPPRHDEDD